MGDNGQSILRVPKTAELLSGHIRRRIVRGELQEGDILPLENALMQEFSVSRPTLREALRILESEGLVAVGRGARGARVQIPSGEVAARYAGLVLQHQDTTFADVLEARTIVEPPAARKVAGLRHRARMNAAQLLQDRVEAHGNDLLNPALTTGFHRLLVELAGNKTLMLFTDMLEFIAESAGAAYITVEAPGGAERNAEGALRSHEKLIELVRAGESEAAEAFWRKHLTERGKAILVAGDITLDVLG